jgi:hypothetical protein
MLALDFLSYILAIIAKHILVGIQKHLDAKSNKPHTN